MDNSFSEPNSSVPNPTSSTPPSSNAPVSSDTNQPTPQTTPQLTTDSPASSSTPAPVCALPVSLTLPTSSPSPHSSPTHSTAQPPHSAPPVHLVQRSHYVPPIQRPILDLSPSSTTPESAVKRALLSDDPSTNSIALVGMGGAGKTTILCALGNDGEVMGKYHDGVWFFELGHDVTLSSFVQQLQAFVKSTLPEFSKVFTELAASEHTHRTMVTQLMKHLVTKHVLLLFDDVWDTNASVYKLVCVMCNVVQCNDNGLLKMLTSTRSSDMADDLADVTVPLNPEELDAEKALAIFCRNAKIDTSDVPSLSAENQHSLHCIIETCAGLALALSVAGSGVRQAMDRRLGRCDESAISVYWGRLKTKPRQLGGAERGGHPGLTSAVETSVQFLEERWESLKSTEELADELSARDMFRSLCIVQKQMIVPVSVLERMWGVGDVQAGVTMLSRNSLVSEVCEEGQGIVGVGVHDLVLDMSVKMSEGEGGVEKWHGRLVDAYVESANGSNGERDMKENEWWELKKDDKYMRENAVRHLLGAGRVSAALKLLTDYRWVEKMNKDEERAPFQKVMSELELVRRHLGEKTETRRRIVHDLGVVARAMELCMVPYCMKNREECTFQLFGRLRDVESESGLVERIVCSIERYAKRPWARCGPGVLTNGRSSLRRVLELEDEGRCMCVSGGGEEVIVGRGKVWVLDGRNGRVKRTLAREEDGAIVGVFFDRTSGLIYSCSGRGQVTIWKEEKKLRSMQAEVGDEEDLIGCMQVLPSSKKVIVGTTDGRLLVFDTTSGGVVRTVAAHSAGVISLAVGGSETVMVSGSWDGTIRAWDTTSFDDSGAVFKGLTRWVTSVALSADGRLLASGSSSDYKSVQLWDVPSGEPLWTSPHEYHNVVVCVLFSSDERLLYSVGLKGTNVWQVGNGGRDVSLAHTLPISSPLFFNSFDLGDGPELFILRGDRVEVWDARQVDCSDDSSGAFLQQVRRFGVSENGTTMVTLNRSSKRMEIRDVCDVCDHIDRVISSFEIPVYDSWHPPDSLAISNNQRFVAYSIDGSCVVHIVDARNGNVLHSLFDLDKWALSLTRHEQDDASILTSCSHLNNTAGVRPFREAGILSFSSDSTVISAFAAANPNPNDDNATTVVTKSVSWNISSGEPMDETHLDADSTATSSTPSPRLVCNAEFDGWFFRFPRNVKYEHGQSSFTIATMEDYVYGAHYISDASRLHISIHDRGMCYVDLITDNTKLPPRNPPPLSLLKPHPPPPQHTITDSEPDQVYDVFISHAGPDKFTIALLLYNLLVALDFKVFLDRAELRPGENAPEKMIKAMRTAKIAVVILSPEYAARKWTLKELMCFMERFRAGGDREIIIIPVFYRLTLDDCRDENSLFDAVNDKGKNVFLAEGFLKWMSKQKELTIEKVLQELQSLRGVTGIENEAKVTNGESEEEKAAQMQLAEKIRDAVVEAKNRQNSGRAAGPSSAR